MIAARLLLAMSLAVLAGPALGVSFNIGELEGQFNSTLSFSTRWSTANPDQRLIGAKNGGRGLSQSGDDGHLNFKKGGTFSKLFKGVHSIELKSGDTGVFIRGQYWYDFELQDQDRPFKDISNRHRQDSAQSSGGQLLDAFVYHNYNIVEQPGLVRFGKQTINWGEETFIGGGINAINPTDVSAYRSPGTQIKDGLVPVNLFYVSQNLNENLSVDAFYQLNWEQNEVDNCGTFFSQSDILAQGCTDNLRVLSPRSALTPGTLSTLERAGVDINNEGVLVRRASDRQARNSGQFGVAVHYVFDPLDTEFGAYFMNYHSRAPILNTRTASASSYAAAAAAGAVGPMLVAGNSQYFVEYPEDIRLYGLSFATTLETGTQWRGELSYRPNAPVQLNTNDLLLAGLRPLGGEQANVSVLDSTPGQDLSGYRRKAITQFQTSVTHIFDHAMGADRLTVDGEIGVIHVAGLESKSQVRYGRDAVFGSGALPGTGGLDTCSQIVNGGASSRYCNNEGFTTATSWGYRARAVWEYDNLWSSIKLKPNLAWSHDVKGYSPSPEDTFEEGRKAITVGLEGIYQDTYTASLAYTNFFGGTYSTVNDRDFVVLSLGMSF